MNNKVKDMLDGAIANMASSFTANSVIGEAITAGDGTIIVPITKVSVGFGGGGSDFEAKNEKCEGSFAGGIGGGASIKAEAFLVINNGNVRIITMDGNSSPVDKVIDMIPGAIDKVNAFIEKRKNKDDLNNDNDKR